MNELVRMRICCTIGAAMLIQGCTYVSYTAPLIPPIEREKVSVTYKSVFDTEKHGEQSASIGDEIFVIRRYMIGERAEIRYKAPDNISPFPNATTWIGTHIYDDIKGGRYTVYTSPLFYKGSLGVILDKDGRPATREPLVQVAGGKTGRRWQLQGIGQFFSRSDVLLEAWGVRYGGKRGESYVFEILNKKNANVIEIIQSVQVTEADFLKGFTIKGVFVKGLSIDRQGVIRYSLQDVRGNS
jgi:hypothetical protein